MTIEKIKSKVLATYKHDNYTFEIVAANYSFGDYTEIWVKEDDGWDKLNVYRGNMTLREAVKSLKENGYRHIAEYIRLCDYTHAAKTEYCHNHEHSEYMRYH